MTARSTKRVNGNYDIYATNMTVHGNLDVVGSTSYIESTNTQIKDAVITLNKGESGAGVTGVYSGLEIDRGTSPKVYLRWNETFSRWEGTPDGTNFFDIIFGSGGLAVAAGSPGYVQYNSGGFLGANVNFNYNSGTNTLTAGGVTQSNYTIGTNATNQDLVLDPNGTGRVVVNAAMKLQNQGSAPVASSGNVYLYANTPGGAGTGVYYVNSSSSGELLSKNKAKLFGLIF
jgi:hypothetical protein